MPLPPEKKENFDQLIIPPPMPVEDFDINNDRMPTASDIRPAPGIPDFQAPPPVNNDLSNTNANTQAPTSVEKPKVQIKPYKFTFD